MPYESRSAARSRKAPEPDLTESRLTIPDALIAWARETERQITWPRPYGDDVAKLLASGVTEPLGPSALEQLLSRLDAIVSAAVAAGRSDLLVGFDFQTAEWLGLSYRVETPRGLLHIGPDPRTRPFEGAREPAWTYGEVRLVLDAKERAAIDLAWHMKQELLEVFPEARISSITFDDPVPTCVACGQPCGAVTMRTDGGEYHAGCFAEMTSPMPEHLRGSKGKR